MFKNKYVKAFSQAFFSAFMIAVTITTIISAAGKASASVPVEQILYDFIMAAFVGASTLIWMGSDKDNKTYIIRSIIHFVVLVTGLTILMVAFGWMPPGNYILMYYVIFVAIYVIIWLFCWRAVKKKSKVMNEKLKEYQGK